MNNNEMPTNVATHNPEDVAQVEANQASPNNEVSTNVDPTTPVESPEQTVIQIETPSGEDYSLPIPKVTGSQPAILPKFVDPGYQQARDDNWRSSGEK